MRRRSFLAGLAGALAGGLPAVAAVPLSLPAPAVLLRPVRFVAVCEGPFITRLNVGGYSDWYLPDRKELESLYEQFHKDGPVANRGDGWYWS